MRAVHSVPRRVEDPGIGLLDQIQEPGRHRTQLLKRSHPPRIQDLKDEPREKRGSLGRDVPPVTTAATSTSASTVPR